MGITALAKDRPDRAVSAIDAPTSPARNGSAHSLMTAGQVAELLGVPRSWVYEQSRLGRIPTVNLGRYRRYRREAIDSWVEELEVAATTAARVKLRR